MDSRSVRDKKLRQPATNFFTQREKFNVRLEIFRSSIFLVLKSVTSQRQVVLNYIPDFEVLNT